MASVPGLMEAIDAAQLGHVRVIVGGIVPKPEQAMLRKAGVARIFEPGASRDEIVGEVAALARQARALGEQA